MKKLTSQIKKIWSRITHQFKVHTVRSVAAVVVISAGVVFAVTMLFSGPTFSYLPDRPYVIAEDYAKTPETLDELLRSPYPDAVALLKRPEIAKELLAAEDILDIAYSRYTLNNLRVLQTQIEEMLAEPEDAYYLPDMDADEDEEMSPITQTTLSIGTSIDKITYTPTASTQYLPPGHTALNASETRVAHLQLIESCKLKIDSLLSSKIYAEPVVSDARLTAHAIWENGEAVLHFTPVDGWLPEDGFNIYRTTKIGEPVLIAEGIAATSKILSGEAVVTLPEATSEVYDYENPSTDTQDIKDIFMQAQLTPDKLTAMGMADEAAFRSRIYVTDKPSAAVSPEKGGADDFLEIITNKLTTKTGLQKMPESDRILNNTISVMDSKSPVDDVSRFKIIQNERNYGLNTLLSESGGETKYKTASEVLEAREQLTALSLTNGEFAEAVGLMFRDDLSGLTFSDESSGNDVTYTIEGGGMITTVVIENGVSLDLTAPTGLMAEGMDGRVQMRWDLAPENTRERGIIVGYLIERKLDGENSFTDICEAPVGIPYMLDDQVNLFYSAPIYFEDEVENGRTAQYRVRSLDIFGRMSDYSDVITVEVKKITPPAAPGVLELTSADNLPSSGVSAAVSASLSANNGRSGIAVPITVNSNDTSRVVIYRSVALGAGGYGKPEILADFPYEKLTDSGSNSDSQPASAEDLYKTFTVTSFKVMKNANPEAQPYLLQASPDVKQGLYRRAKHLSLIVSAVNMPDIIFFDATAEKGASYKYWASAWDETGNESAWSQAAIISLPDETYQPQTPTGLSINMLARELPDLSVNPPGLVEEGLITYNKIAASISEGIPMRSYNNNSAVNKSLIKEADSKGVNIGKFITDAPTPIIPPEINADYDNLPEDKYIHIIAAVRGEDVIDGSAYLEWPAYGGDGLKGYVIYKPVGLNVTMADLPQLQTLSRSELIGLCDWKKFGGSFMQNQALIASGLNASPGSLNIFLICLQPDETGGSSLLGMLSNTQASFLSLNEAGLMKNIQAGGYSFINPWTEDESVEDDTGTPQAGFVRLAWEEPDDPQIKYYRIYRAEAKDLETPVDHDTLDWTLIGDYLKQPVYSDPVEQTVAHFYYYKVTPVSAWGVETETGTVQAFRVPSTKPPETPNIRVPLAAKGGVRIYFSSVPDATEYVLYRLTLPRITQKDIEEWFPPADAVDAGAIQQVFVPGWVTQKGGYLQEMFEDMKNGGWRNPVINPESRLEGLQMDSLSRDSFSTQINQGQNFQQNFHQDTQQGMQQNAQQNFQQTMQSNMAESSLEYALLSTSIQNLNTTASETQGETRLNPLTKFKTVAQSDQLALYNDISASGTTANLELYQKIVEKFGVLAVTGYGDLSVGSMKELNNTWEIVKAEPARAEAVNPSTGMLEPLFILDDTAEYGVYYLYTVQARNDDLDSQRSEPVLGTPRRNGPFVPLDVHVDSAQANTIRWNPPQALQDKPGVILTEEQVQVDTIGYIVYRSDYRDGPYYQLSDLLFDTTYSIPLSYGNKWYTDGWYNVKVLDTGGYFSEFGEPVRIVNEYPRQTLMMGSLPENLALGPVIIIEGENFTAKPGEAFSTPYILEGSEPKTVSVAAKNSAGASVSGFTVDTDAQKVAAPKNLPSGIYTVTATAKNDIGESSDSFTLEVTAAATPPVIAFNNAKFTAQQGTVFQTAYSLTGTEPITVTVIAVDQRGGVASGFSINTSARTVSASDSLNAGMYTVTATAKNTVGESTAIFTLEVTASATPPVIAFNYTKFTAQQGTAFQTAYSLTGTEPITVTVTAMDQRGGVASGFSVNTSARTVSASDSLNAGMYTVTVTAKNSAGESTAIFTLEIIAARSAPVIADEKHNYNFEMNEGKNLNITISASGSTPISWSLESSDKMPLPSFVSIGASTGELAVSTRATAGTYYFVVKATNDVGTDTRLCTLNVIASQVAPKITTKAHTNQMTQSTDYEMQFTATGSAPLYWSLEPIPAATHVETVPVEASIDNTGKLKIQGSIAAGEYSFIVKVSNDVGSDSFDFTIQVSAYLLPIRPKNQVELVNIRSDINQPSSVMGVSSLATDAEGKLLDSSPVATIVQPILPVTPSGGLQQSSSNTLHLGKAGYKGFILHNINVVKQTNNLYNGTATLDIGCGTMLPATITNGSFSGTNSSSPAMQSGEVTMTQPITLNETRLTIGHIEINNNISTVSGYVQSPPRGETSDGGEGTIDFAGGAISFVDATLTYGKINVLTANFLNTLSDDILNDNPLIYQKDWIKCGRFTFSEGGNMTISMDAALSGGAPWLELSAYSMPQYSQNKYNWNNWMVKMILPWESLEPQSHDHFMFTITENVKFDLQGRILSGKLVSTRSIPGSAKVSAASDWAMQLLVPGGACLYEEPGMVLTFSNGHIMPNARLKGQLLLPFERWDEEMEHNPVPQARYANSHTYTNDVDNLIEYIQGLTDELTQDTIDALIKGLIEFGKTTQRSGLLLCPEDSPDRCASINVDIANWDGGGFVIEDTSLSPVNIVERSLGKDEDGVQLQRTQGMKLVTTRVALDLDRNNPTDYAAALTGKMTPSEYKEPFWTGLIVKGGTLSLPGAFLETASGGTVDFALMEGEMLYDINGFNYQTYLYSIDQDGEPINFSEELGNFPNARIHDCLLDLYANRVNIEVNCTVPLEVFNGQKVNAKLQSDSITGKWLCSVAPTEFEPDSFVGGYGIVVDGGWFKRDGVHLNGRMTLPGLSEDADVKTDDFISITDMIIPSSRNALNPTNALYKEKYANITLDTPVILNFNDFDFTVRNFQLTCINKSAEHIWNRITFSGSTFLGESIPLLSQSLDTIVVQSDRHIPAGMDSTSRTAIQPVEVDYNLCNAALQNNFDQSFEFSGVLKPKSNQNQGMKSSSGSSERFVEYLPDEDEEFSFGFLNSLELLPLEIHARFGYDKQEERTFYVIGFKTTPPFTIPLGAGELSEVAGIAASNMVVERDPAKQDRMALSNAKNDMRGFVENMQPNPDKQSTFQAALICKMTIAEICIVDNMYFGFTNGPIVETGGDLSVALSLEALTGGGGPDNPNKYTNLGDVLLRYDHPNRHFSCNVQFDTEILGVDIYGNAGFEASPSLLRIYIGYPDYFTGELDINVFNVLQARVAIGMGQEFSTGKENDKFFAQYSQKTRYDLAGSMDIDIVYIKVSAHAGAEGTFRLSKPTTAEIDVYLNGKIVGGIWFFGKRDIIMLQLDAWGNMYAEIGGSSSIYWKLKAKATVHYGIDLGVVGSISGSVTANLNTSFRI